MDRKLIILFLISIFCLGMKSNEFKFELEISGMAQAKGNLMIAIFKDAATFPEEKSAVHKLVFPVTKKSVVLDLSKYVKLNEKFAIALFHDENGNKKLDKNLFGVPTERYGFSNNARGTFGPPSFSESAINLKGSERHQITLK